MTVEDQTLFKNEIDMMRLIDHPNVVKMIDVMEDDKYNYIVMERLSGGNVNLNFYC
jgi:serine/threonine protein kinase